MGHRRARLAGALLLGGALLAGCAPRTPAASSLLARVDAAMAHSSSYRLTGGDRAGQTASRFQALVNHRGDFAASLVTSVPGSPSLRSRVVAVAGHVYVLAPIQLQELGIASLPGDLSPATTWVEQPPAVARSYHRSLSPFFGPGLARTLRQALRGQATVRPGRRRGRSLWVVTERSRQASLRLWIDASTGRLLQLRVRGPQPVSLVYSHFGGAGEVNPPPSANVYVPPTPAPGG
ncbi:MAG: hypothetical protein ACREOD_08595 [Candidatus Dormibacteria bacterium]